VRGAGKYRIGDNYPFFLLALRAVFLLTTDLFDSYQAHLDPKAGLTIVPDVNNIQLRFTDLGTSNKQYSSPFP
jgi:hypothetical protein